MPNQDHLDFIQDQWKREKPELDTHAMAMIGRLYRLTHFLRTEVDNCHKAFGLRAGEFDVLATLLRSGEPWRLTPTVLFQSAMLSSGAMTNRLNRLEEAGLIRRIPDADDRRSLQVELTTQGKEKIDSAIEAHVSCLQQLAGSLSEQQGESLNTILKHWLATLE
jgi:DNA-binding MarR family transcriptional regulator